METKEKNKVIDNYKDYQTLYLIEVKKNTYMFLISDDINKRDNVDIQTEHKYIKYWDFSMKIYQEVFELVDILCAHSKDSTILKTDIIPYVIEVVDRNILKYTTKKK